MTSIFLEGITNGLLVVGGRVLRAPLADGARAVSIPGTTEASLRPSTLTQPLGFTYHIARWHTAKAMTLETFKVILRDLALSRTHISGPTQVLVEPLGLFRALQTSYGRCL